MNWHYRYTVLTLCTGAFFTTMVARLSISPLVPLIVRDFRISNGLVGLALTGMWFAYALTQYPSGVLADRYGERPVILLALGGTGVACLLLVLSPIFLVFAVFTVLLGSFAGLHYSVATTLLSQSYDNLGTAIGVHNLGAPLAGLLAPIAAVAIAERFGWRAGLALGTAVALPVFVAFARYVRADDSTAAGQSTAQSLEVRSHLRLLSKPSIAFTILIATANSFVLQGTISFLPTVLVLYHEYSSTVSSVAFSAFFITNGIVQVMVGSVSDQYGRDRTIAGSVLAGLVGVVFLITASDLVSLALAIFLIGIGLSAQTAIQPRFLDHLTEAERNSGFGIVRTVYMVGASTSGVVLGVTADVFNWGVAFGICGLLLAAIVVSLAVNRTFDLGY